MPRFIIDANLPSKVPCWDNEAFVHVLQLNAGWTDDQIWVYAKESNLAIISKDKDFSVKQILEGSPPRLIHIKFGNLRLNEFVNRIETVWHAVENLLQDHSVVNIYINKIEAIR